MGKPKRKLSKRFKRTIGFVLSGLFLVSAAGVALLPQKDIKAYTPNAGTKYYLEDSENHIPEITDTDVIYTTGDGVFQFILVKSGSSSGSGSTGNSANSYAVICGYDYARSLPDDPVKGKGYLEIPDAVDAYKKYTDSAGTFGGYVAVSKKDEFLFYPIYESQTVDVDNDGIADTDSEGNTIYVDVLSGYQPCYYSTYDSWINDKSGNPRAPEDYYYEDTPGHFAQVGSDSNHQRVVGAAVLYIANQHVEVTSGSQGWVLSTDDSTGVFSRAGNLENLYIKGSNMIGIGNNAFNGCSNLSSITLANGINTIGNYAFANCRNLTTVSIPDIAAISIIGEHAFYNCHKLQSFSMPTNVTKIGDSCFENCISMTQCNLTIANKSMGLSQLGKNVFKGCTALESLEFPLGFNEDQELEWYEDCTSLKYIKVPDARMTFTDSSTFTYNDFLEQVPEDFYFEGKKNQNLHNVCTNNAIAFKFMDEDDYEKVFTDSATGGKTVFHVNADNELTYFYMDPSVQNVTIPGTIGPYHITKIAADSFQNNEEIKRINIPSSITEIEAEAFKGCYNLEDVIFDEPINLTYIGADAFDTQQVDTLAITGNPPAIPSLSFTGVASPDSAPFAYAMNKNNNINNTSQPVTYIKFYTGWPTNQVIQYNPDTDENELIEVPTLTTLSSLGNAPYDYPYLTLAMKSAAADAYTKYQNNNVLTEDEANIINAALNVDVPEGVTAFKDDLFSTYDENTDSVTVNNNCLQTITTHSIKEIKDHQFAGIPELTGVYINDDCTKIGDYAFEDCDKLVDVDIHSPVQEFGKAPFAGCSSLEDVDFGNDTPYYCKDAIIYNDVNGERVLIEVLPSRGLPKADGSGLNGTRSISASEMAGIKEIAPSAFEDCDGIYSVDFSESNISDVPDSAFKDTDGLSYVLLNDGVKRIAKDAFKNSSIGRIEIPKSCAVIDNSAFDGTAAVEVYCESDAPARSYVEGKPNMSYSEKPTFYEIKFFDDDTMDLIATEKAMMGTKFDLDHYFIPEKDGYHFVKYKPSGNLNDIRENINVNVVYEKDDNRFIVTFLDWNGSKLFTQLVEAGQDCTQDYRDPEREGYVFAGWLPAITNITENRTVIAQYEKKSETNIVDPDDGKKENPDDGKKDDNKEDDKKENPDDGKKENPDDGKKENTDTNKENGNTNNNTPQPTPPTPKLYTLTVEGGSGSGSYVEGASVIIMANNPESGQLFDKWTHDADVKLVKDDIAATYLNMPAKDIVVKATYKSDTTKKNENNNAGNNNGGTTTTVTKPNTTVSLTKTGFSNNGLASATVGGSSDNFVLKITDSQTAKAEIEDALLAEYGSLDNIKYVAMDISLYDSTGATKIKNTEDLSVSITLPIPDDLLPYAGNNKVAYVVNGKLVKLNPKFTTINGVPCMTFVAPHFSPYTIYVDTTDLSSSVTFTPNSTPKTGDGLGIKWIISIGLLAMSVLCFALCIPTGKKNKITKG